MSCDDDTPTPAEILRDLRNSGWTEEDIKSVPRLAVLLYEENQS